MSDFGRLQLITPLEGNLHWKRNGYSFRPEVLCFSEDHSSIAVFTKADIRFKLGFDESTFLK
jgi:hypothetical protein